MHLVSILISFRFEISCIFTSAGNFFCGHVDVCVNLRQFRFDFFMNEMAKCIYRSFAHMPFHAWNTMVSVSLSFVASFSFIHSVRQ